MLRAAERAGSSLWSIGSGNLEAGESNRRRYYGTHSLSGSGAAGLVLGASFVDVAELLRRAGRK